MKNATPSRTAHLVAMGRAMADAGMTLVPGFKDPTARAFLSDKGERSLAATLQKVKDGKTGVRMQMAHAMANMMALRTSAIDAAVRDALAGGAKQLVILGAGYDGRAWRMPELAGVKVFEVDHPATQGDKRSRVARLGPSHGAVTFVPIDFEREALNAVLDRAGHDPSQPTCWIWEGVVMYLTREAMLATLRAIGSRSAAGSTLIVNYHTGRRGWFASLMFRLIGEPQISSWTPGAMAADLLSAGYVVHEDSGMNDWNAHFAGSRANVARGFYMRVTHARKK